MFKKFAVTIASIAVLISTQAGAALAGTTVSKIQTFNQSATFLPSDSSEVATMPNGHVVAFTTDWNMASLIANRIDVAGRPSTQIFGAGTKVGQNQSHFAWSLAPNGRLYLIYTTYTLPSGSGFATAGVKIRSTTDGETWSSPVNVFDDVSVGFNCTPASQVCGYLQPNLEIAPNGTLLATALQVTDATHLKVKTAVSADGTTWATPSNLTVTNKFSNMDPIDALYSGGKYLHVSVTQTGFTLLYPFSIPAVWPSMIGEGGYAAVTLPFNNLQAWQTPTLAMHVTSTTSNTGGTVVLGPYLAFSGGKLSTFWFSRDSNGLVNLVLTNFDESSNFWSPITLSPICNSCALTNDIVRQQDRIVATASHIVVPFVTEPLSTPAVTLRSLRTVSITGGIASSPVTVLADLSANSDVHLYGILEGADSSLMFLERQDQVAYLIKTFGGTVSTSKIKDIGATYFGVKFSLTAAMSTGGVIHMALQEYRDDSPTATYYDYYRAINSTKPTFVGVVLVSGVAKVGKKLAVSQALFTEASGNVSSKTQWYRCPKYSAAPGVVLPKGCVAIQKATLGTYKVVSADVGKYILAKVTSTNSNGSSVIFSDTSNKVAK